ncbi:hypothetical protein [Aromatoleum aromaticum]|uniref:Uncharacterized protein n=1 Tax=Aromatoleum aromaticum (strain DSM 19018 / LMG 30748 / EbN1) TaxID=76114 RepID=Q5P4M9_AROAE|nr:hypothetical protein [Aromatoleum aromaticum]NMG56781.1 hypothetical protein [Aromatoleum aromaticum]CAI07733.1 hypothetical protein ebA2859 [Aromatoleum aromaticum EbN1]
MKRVLDPNGLEIGAFDGATIKCNGNIVYWISDNEVFAPANYTTSDLKIFNKGQCILIGEFVDGECIVDGEVIFRLSV